MFSVFNIAELINEMERVMSNELMKQAYEHFEGVWPYDDVGGMAYNGRSYAYTSQSDWLNTTFWKWVGTKADFDAYGESLKEEWKPEVGMECEFECTAKGKEISSVGLIKYLSKHTCVIDRCDSAGEFVAHPDTIKFRPIKTESEKQAERNKGIIDVIDFISEWEVAGETIECAVNSAFGEGMWGDIKGAVELGLVKPKGCEKQTDAMFDIVEGATDLYHACELLHDAGWRSSKSIGSSIFNACRDNYSSNYWREISASVYKDLDLKSEAEKVLK